MTPECKFRIHIQDANSRCKSKAVSGFGKGQFHWSTGGMGPVSLHQEREHGEGSRADGEDLITIDVGQGVSLSHHTLVEAHAGLIEGIGGTESSVEQRMRQPLQRLSGVHIAGGEVRYKNLLMKLLSPSKDGDHNRGGKLMPILRMKLIKAEIELFFSAGRPT